MRGGQGERRCLRQRRRELGVPDQHVAGDIAGDHHGAGPARRAAAARRGLAGRAQQPSQHIHDPPVRFLGQIGFGGAQAGLDVNDAG